MRAGTYENEKQSPLEDVSFTNDIGVVEVTNRRDPYRAPERLFSECIT